ncbi:MAG: deoxyribose-phosphate aldolase [Ignavibacteriaceae bacterium]|nr:MAG: deoxyribose-phosphate aldolase [Chlorobi bacterium OLB4]MBV6399229.1 Deoxyribose-phosphate aldolase [Ignavibacteria bacterium]MCC6884902.1 deoxyribose-phosphate aldolase [Ignavibacteriales bacterium]MEB2329329.1 deoxyribose-phosphate aldolase [Ignavibacteriaceae bacterium]
MSNVIKFLDRLNYGVDAIGTNERAAFFSGRSIKKESKIDALNTIISMIDLTTLEGKDTAGKVYSICSKAIRPIPADSSVPHVAAVCLYPNMLKYAKRALEGSGVKLASVATAFPSGQFPLKLREEDTAKCIRDGADEIDMVISRGEFLKGNYDVVFEEIRRIKNICTEESKKASDKTGKEVNVHLKVILETGELETYDNVRNASIIAMLAGADFIKTSTGKVQPAATLPVTLVMLEAIRDYYNETGILTGMKPAGGIRKSKEAIAYLVMLNETLGYQWMTPDLFRFGASSLLNDVLMQLVKQKTGYYQGLDYFTID